MQLAPVHPPRFIFLAFALLGTGCQTGKYSDGIHISSSPPGAAVFEDSVKPVLEHRCIQCHNHQNSNSGLNFENRASVFAGTSAGPFLVPGKPQDSRIWQALIRPANHAHTMPRDGWGMDVDEMEAFKRWIELGATWPTDESGQLTVKEYRVTRREYL